VGIDRTEMMLGSSPQHLQGNAKDKNMNMWDSQQRCWQAPQALQGNVEDKNMDMWGFTEQR